MRIGALIHPIVNARYRAYYPLDAMAALGHEVVLPSATTGRLPMPDLVRCDAILIYRHWDAELRRVATQLKRRGVGIVWDDDDDSYHAPMSRKNRRRLGLSGKQVFSEMVATARLAHVPVVSTETLASVFTRAGVQGVRVLPNMLPAGPLRPRVPHAGLTIGWIAATEHEGTLPPSASERSSAGSWPNIHASA